MLKLLLIPLTIFLVACGGVSTDSITDTFQDATQTENSTTDGNAVSGEQPSSCGGAGLLKKLDAEYAANPYRARAEYEGEKMCVQGTVSKFLEMYGGPGHWYPAVLVDVSSGEGFIIWDYSFKGDYAAWDEWMMAVSVGDKVEADCQYALDRVEVWTHPYPESGSLFEAFIGCEMRY